MNNIQYIEIIKNCPHCNSELIIENNNGIKTLKCNNQNCNQKFIAQIEHFCSKEHGLDIKGLSKKTIEKLVSWRWLENISDIFILNTHRSEWINMPGFGQKSVDKILAAIEDAKRCELTSFIAALGIPLIGRTVVWDLIKVFPTYEELRTAIDDGFNFSTIDGFGPAKDKALKEFDWSSADYIYENYLDSFTTFAQEYVSSNTLDGVTACITGKLQHFKNREQFKIAIINAGGKVTDSVTKKINYLINNDINSTSSKNKKAKEYNIEIISEGDFIKKFGLKDADS